MRVLFVVEASSSVGLGHLLRCRPLLLELKSRGHACDFWLYGDSNALDGRDWPVSMDRFWTPDSEPVSMAGSGIDALLGRTSYDWVVVDGYRFSGKIIEGFSASGAKLLVMDDIGNREITADVVVNQNSTDQMIYASGCVEATCFLLGPQYAMIDEAYRASGARSGREATARRILVTFGGVDRYDRTGRVLELLEQHTDPLSIVAVVGPYYPYRDRLKSRRGRHELQVLESIVNLAAQMTWCDLLITGAGSTVWQACCSGVPMLALQASADQKFVCRTLQTSGAGICLDVSGEPEREAGVAEHLFMPAFQSLTDERVRAALSSRAVQLVDGNGARRVADILGEWERAS